MYVIDNKLYSIIFYNIYIYRERDYDVTSAIERHIRVISVYKIVEFNRNASAFFHNCYVPVALL